MRYLDDMVHIYSTSKENRWTVFQSVYTFYIPTTLFESYPCPTSLWALVIVSFAYVILIGVQWDFMVSVCIWFLMMLIISAYLPSLYFLWWSIFWNICPFFPWIIVLRIFFYVSLLFINFSINCYTYMYICRLRYKTCPSP